MYGSFLGNKDDAMSKETAVSDLTAHLGYWLRYVSNHVSHAFARKVEARGVTVAEWVLLRQLLESGGARAEPPVGANGHDARHGHKAR